MPKYSSKGAGITSQRGANISIPKIYNRHTSNVSLVTLDVGVRVAGGNAHFRSSVDGIFSYSEA